MTKPEPILLSISIGGEDWEVDVTDQSFVTRTLGGQNISLIRTPMGVMAIASDCVGKTGQRRHHVIVFSEKQWDAFKAAEPYSIEAVTEP